MADMSDTQNTSTEAPVVPSDEAAPAEVVDKPHATKAPASGRRPSPAGQTVSGEKVDQVLLSSVVYKNPKARKSLSVHHLQRRLAELGYPDAYTDKDGWYGDLTRKAVAEYQRDNGLDGEGIANAATLEHLFSDDPNVAVVA